jgi:para-nitrobenzyl esterase
MKALRLYVAVVAVVVGGLVTVATVQADSGGSTECTSGLLVHTDKGPVCGIVGSGVQEWLGVPFAAPPVGPLRWEPPQPHAAWSTPLQANTSRGSCPQASSGGAGIPSDDEDCLYLNVIAPSASGSGPLPVMVWIYGGGFVVGTNTVYDATHLVTAGHVILVAMNYREGVFGFLADKALGPNAGDYGLQDQQAAMRWVKRNIAAFGGDPGNVTVFGESAGGSSVCDQIASPTAAGLFQKAISESGEYNSLLGAPTSLQPQDCHAKLPTEAQADQVGQTYAASLGCGNASDAAACLRSVPASKLLATEFSATDAPIVNGTTLPLSPRTAFASGKVNRATVIMGVNRDEDLVGTPSTASDYQSDVQAQYGAFASKVMSLYPLDRFASPYIAFRTLTADSDTICPALITDKRLARVMPVFAYEFDDTDPPPSTASNPTLPAGAPHGAEIPLLFPNFLAGSLDANQTVLFNQLAAQWTHFASTGNPTAPGTPIWTPFTEGNQRVMSLQPAGDSQLTDDIPIDHNCGFWSQFMR